MAYQYPTDVEGRRKQSAITYERVVWISLLSLAAKPERGLLARAFNPDPFQEHADTLHCKCGNIYLAMNNMRDLIIRATSSETKSHVRSVLSSFNHEWIERHKGWCVPSAYAEDVIYELISE